MHILSNKQNVNIKFSEKDSYLNTSKFWGPPPPMLLSGAGTPCQIGLRKKSALKLSNNSIFGGLKCNGKFRYIFFLFLDNFNKFVCIISVLNLNDGNVPKIHVRNIPNFEVGNVPSLKLGNCIQSIIMLPGHAQPLHRNTENTYYIRFRASHIQI